MRTGKESEIIGFDILEQPLDCNGKISKISTDKVSLHIVPKKKCTQNSCQFAAPNSDGVAGRIAWATREGSRERRFYTILGKEWIT